MARTNKHREKSLPSSPTRLDHLSTPQIPYPPPPDHSLRQTRSGMPTRNTNSGEGLMLPPRTLPYRGQSPTKPSAVPIPIPSSSTSPYPQPDYPATPSYSHSLSPIDLYNSRIPPQSYPSSQTSARHLHPFQVSYSTKPYPQPYQSYTAGETSPGSGSGNDYGQIVSGDRSTNGETSTDFETGGSSTLTLPRKSPTARSKAKSKATDDTMSDAPRLTKSGKPPRPPNAWIIYRSYRVSQCALGEGVEEVNAVIRELAAKDKAANNEKAGLRSLADLPENPLSKTGSVEPSAETSTPPTSGHESDLEPKKELDIDTETAPVVDPTAMLRGKSGKGLPQSDISRIMSVLWKRESPEVRREYERKAEIMKVEHAKQNPGYKYTPARKADKIRISQEKEREREAARLEKEMLNAGGGRSRRARTRKTKPSPSSPYAVGESSRPDLDRGNARTLSYGEAPVHPSSEGLAAGTGVFWGGNPSLEAFYEDGDRSYPFPMPPRSLPSMKPEDHVNNPFLGNPAETSGLSTKAHTQAHPEMQHGFTWSGHEQNAALSYSWPPDQSMEGFDPNSWIRCDLEPLPFVGDQPFDLSAYEEPSDGLNGTTSMAPDHLAAMWCCLEEDDPSAMHPADGSMAWTMDVNEAPDQWAQLGGDTNVFNEIELTSDVGQMIFDSFAASHGQIPAQQPGQQSSSSQFAYPFSAAPPQEEGFFPSIFSAQSPFMSFNVPVEEGATLEPDTSEPASSLSAEAFSPGGTWAPGPGEFLTAAQENVAPARTFSASSAASASSAQSHQTTRYVSNSAFPLTPLSVDPVHIPSRNLSFSALNSVGIDMDSWEVDEEEKPAAAPVAEHPVPVTQAGPPRGTRRARTVGQKFDASLIEEE
ncbi:hypothetical protein P7C73_g4349, partial [Tremellales sp. Uapishka_1]